MIPIRDSNPARRAPVVTIALIAANVAVFVLWQPSFGTQREQDVFYFCHAEIPFEVSHQENLAQGGLEARLALDEDFGAGNGALVQSTVQEECPDKSWLLSVFVAMFLHGGWLHLGGNMLFLWVFGNNVEDRLGYVVYPLFYVLGGLAASGLQLAFDANSTIPSLGASGAIGAVLGAYIVLFPHARVTTLVIFFFITVVEIRAGVVLAIWFVLQLFSGVGQLGSDVNGGVAYWAHVGGFAFGALVAWLFYRRRGGIEPPVYGVPRTAALAYACVPLALHESIALSHADSNLRWHSASVAGSFFATRSASVKHVYIAAQSVSAAARQNEDGFLTSTVVPSVEHAGIRSRMVQIDLFMPD